jgi:hypothetical protein
MIPLVFNILWLYATKDAEAERLCLPFGKKKMTLYHT